MRESDEVQGYQYRLAQARRLLRFMEERKLDPHNPTVEDLAPILDEDGRITPGEEDLEWVKSHPGEGT